MNYINEYYPTSIIKNFPNLDTELKQYYDFVFDIEKPVTGVPRAFDDYRVCCRDIFYYLSFIYDNNPARVIDIGCGENSFKKWFPNIYGVDIAPTRFLKNRPDEIMQEDFYEKNVEQFDGGFAINSYHFVSFISLEDNINKSLKLIKTGKRFLFTVNSNHVLGKLHNTELKMANEKFDEKLYDLLTSKYNVILFDPVISRGFVNVKPQFNGSVRFILEK